MRRLLLTTGMLLLSCSACLAQVSTMGSTAMGLPTTPGTIVTSPLNGPGAVLSHHPAGHFRHDPGAGAPGLRPHDARDGRDLFHTNRTNRARYSGGPGYVHVGHGWHDGIDAVGYRTSHDIRCPGSLFRVCDG